MTFYLLPPDIAKSRFKGHAGFTDSKPGQSGVGIAGYTRSPGYRGYEVPTKVGARYFFPDPEFDETTDQAIPAAMGNKFEPGGADAYRLKVFKAAQAVGESQGLRPAQIEELDPKYVAPKVGPRKVAKDGTVAP